MRLGKEDVHHRACARTVSLTKSKQKVFEKFKKRTLDAKCYEINLTLVFCLGSEIVDFA